MRRYTVLIPFTGYMNVEVKAESEEEAIVKACSEASWEKHVEEWNLHRHVVRGNVSSALLNEVEVYED